MSGKSTKYKSVTKLPDDDTTKFTMWMGDGKDQFLTITYTRKK